MPNRRSVYSNSARFADLRVVCLSRAIEYKSTSSSLLLDRIRIGVGVDTGIGITMFGGVGLYALNLS
jgi:hypothetical protein